MTNFTLQIIRTLNQNTIQIPVLTDEVTLDRNYNSSAATLDFTCQKDEKLAFDMGDIVVLTVDYKVAFRGRIFTKSRNSNKKIQVTAYDNLRYLLNEDTIVLGQDNPKKNYYTLKDLLDKIRQILQTYWFTLDYSITNKEISNVKLDPVVYEDKSYIDMIFDTFEKIKTKGDFNLTIYDDNGKIVICDINDLIMRGGTWVDPYGATVTPMLLGNVEPTIYSIGYDNIEDFSHEESIDDDVYTVVKLTTEGENANKTQSHLVFEKDNLKQYGPLICSEKVDDAKEFSPKGRSIIGEKGRSKNTFSITGCTGMIEARGGSGLYIDKIDVGHTVYRGFMLVKEVTHKFKGQTHTMDLKFTTHPKNLNISRVE